MVFFYYSLLLYGVVCTLQEKHEAAETFFEAATCVQPKSILAWTMLGKIYFLGDIKIMHFKIYFVIF
jgi:hypothetical protein